MKSKSSTRYHSGIQNLSKVKVGDGIIYSKFVDTEYKVGEENYLLLKESDVLAKITK